MIQKKNIKEKELLLYYFFFFYSHNIEYSNIAWYLLSDDILYIKFFYLSSFIYYRIIYYQIRTLNMIR